MEASPNPVAIERANLADAHWLLEQVVDGLSDGHLHWHPPGTTNTIAATYAHVIASEDQFVEEVLRQRTSLGNSEWSGKTGIRPSAPRRGADWFEWSRHVHVDLPQARAYAAAVYQATDDYLASLKPGDLARAPSVPIPGNQTLSWLLHNLLVQHAALHSGEIAVLRGLQGLIGLP